MTSKRLPGRVESAFWKVDEVVLSRCDGAELRVVFRSKLSEAGGLFAADLRAFMRETDLPASVRGR